MKNQLSKIVLLILIVGAVSYATSSFAIKKAVQEQTPGAGKTAVERAHQWVHEVALTEDQKSSLAPLETALKKDLDGLQVELSKQRIALCRLMSDPKTAQKDLEPAIGKVAALEAMQQRMVVGHLMAMKKVLTPAQNEKLFTSMMRDICTGCREMSCEPGTPCFCGRCSMAHKAG